MTPETYRIHFPKKEIKTEFTSPNFGIVFGGQMKEIQRLVFGTDFRNILKIRHRHVELLRKYREKIIEDLQQNNISAQVIEPTSEALRKELDFWGGGWTLDGFEADWGDFSEQNAIECVDFLIDIMIKSQQFSSGMPTVGGEVHIALITSKDGLRFISREEYVHKGHFVPKHII